MEKAVEHVQSQFTSVRTGRATPALVEKLLGAAVTTIKQFGYKLEETAPAAP